MELQRRLRKGQYSSRPPVRLPVSVSLAYRILDSFEK